MSSRSSSIGNDRVWQSHPAIAAARTWSTRRVEQIRAKLNGIEHQIPAVRCVVLSGSLARLDACEHSDIDLIVIVHDSVNLSSNEAGESVRAVWGRLAEIGLSFPQSQGVFVSPSSRQQLCDGARGVVDEPVDIFGKRIQLLLEARPVAGSLACRQLQRDILLRYSRHPFAHRAGERWSYLTDDLVRYWRSYRVWRHWDPSPSNGGWFVRNLKLRHSRRLTIASLLIPCLGELIDSEDVEEMLKVVRLTPLERVRKLQQLVGGEVFQSVCRHYDAFLGVVNDPDARRALEQRTVSNPEQALKNAPEEFTQLMENGDKLRDALWSLIARLPDDAGARLIL